MLDWCMANEGFKIQLFRFIDVFPYLTNDKSLTHYINAYFGGKNNQLPPILRWGTKSMQFGGKLATNLLAMSIRKGIENTARHFIVGANIQDALQPLNQLRTEGCAFSIDLLGETVVNEEEADQFQKDGNLRFIPVKRRVTLHLRGRPKKY